MQEENGVKYTIIYGDLSPIMRRISKNLEKAIEFAANDIEK